MKIIFEANVFTDFNRKSSSRSGIFFTAYNIFLEMLKHKDVEMYIYCDVKSYYIIKNFFIPHFKNISFINPYNKAIEAISWGHYLRSKYFPKNIWTKFLAKSFTLSLLIAQKILLIFPPKVILKKEEYYIWFSPRDEIPKDIFYEEKIIKFILIHDLIPLILTEYFSKDTKEWFNQLVNSLNEKYGCYNFYVNSNQTKNDLLKYFPQIDPFKISLTYLAASDNFYPDMNEEKNISIRQKYNIPEDKKYIFSLCSLEPRKNLLFVIENFIQFIKENNIDDLVFVLGGGYWEVFIKQLVDKIGDLDKNKSKIIYAGYIDDEDLANLYSHSLCSIYLSLYEGFGLPALEAMKCGSALIASNTTSIPEVVGNGGILINPIDSKSLQNAFKQIYFDEDFRKSLIQKAIIQSEKFSWEKCVNTMLKKMREVLNNKILEEGK